jgi:ribosome-dependent ATPase
VSFFILFAMTLLVFRVPLKGSPLALVLGALLYVTATTGYGMFISSFARTQIAALFGTAILSVIPATQFAGMLTPVSSLSGTGALIGQVFPMTYFLRISVGTFTKGLGFSDLGIDLAALAASIPALTLLSLLFLRKQEI